MTDLFQKLFYLPGTNNMFKKPFVTIITSTYNASLYLEESINSIASQTYKNFEYIIIDGASTDGTLDIIKNHESIITFWSSSKDSGIYEAWNKGLKHSNGDWILFLGADDQLLPDALETYVAFITKNQDKTFDYISSKVKLIATDGSFKGIVGKPWKWSEFKYRMTTAHPGSFHSKNLFLKFGNYNEKYKIVADYEILLRARKTLKTGYIDQITVLMSTGTNLKKIDATMEGLTMFRRSKHLNIIQLTIHYINIIARFFLKEQFNKLK